MALGPGDCALLRESQCGCKETDSEKGDDEVSYHCNHIVLCTGLAQTNPDFGDSRKVPRSLLQRRMRTAYFPRR